MPAKFVVRYWCSLLAAGYSPPDAEPHWLDYSIHPASKLGLHNALLAVHDRNEILEAYGAYYECAVFLLVGDKAEKLSAATANTLFAALPHGDIKWLDIRRFLPPPTATPEAAPAAMSRRAEQLPLFLPPHTPYDDLNELPHFLDIDA